MGTFSVGVDMDALHHYVGIHGLGEGGGDEAWSLGCDRFIELFDGLGLKGSFYCVAEDLTRSPSCEPALKRALSAGHEVGNHSWRHPYRLTELPYPKLFAEVSEGKRLLESALSTEVVGFRAPGYHTSHLVQRALTESDHRYESSAFPCAPYYIAKALIMGLMRLRGRRSASLLGGPRLLFAPRQPYIADPAQPYRRLSLLPTTPTPLEVMREELGQPLRHFPISVWWGAPLIGTALTALGPRMASWVTRRAARAAARSGGHLTLEFHAVDLLSLSEDQLDPRLNVQPDLKSSLAHKRACFEASLRACLEEGLRCERLIDLATP